jgi:hypothetical protein
VNKLGWVFTYSDDFVTATETYLSDIETKSCAGPSEKEAEKLLDLKNSLAEFVAAAKRLLKGDMDPLTLPMAVQTNGQPIPNYFVLRVTPWLGFYRLDCVQKVGVGIIALHEDDKLQDKLAKLLADAAKKPR